MMTTQKRIKRVLTLAALAMALFGLTVSANAQIIVTPDHISSGSATATLVAIDVPYQATWPASGGPDWPEDADDGFTTVNNPIQEPRTGVTSNWEPDGTPLSEAVPYFTYGNGPVPSVKYVFDIPDGAIIYAIYATWFTRNKDGCTYEYTEGAASDTTGRRQDGAAPNNDLVLSWTDSDTNPHVGDFELLFDGPITVEGGDGFELWATDNIGNAAHIDAVVIDVEMYTDPNFPDVDAGGDMISWSGQDVAMDPTIVEAPGSDWTSLTYLWTAEPDLDVAITGADTENASVTITKAATTGDATVVTMTLAVNNEDRDGEPVTDTMTIDVYDDSCLAAMAVGPVVFDQTDIDKNCITAFPDFAVMAATWLDDYALTEAIAK